VAPSSSTKISLSLKLFQLADLAEPLQLSDLADLSQLAFMGRGVGSIITSSMLRHALQPANIWN
jgi:hypothetical protein